MSDLNDDMASLNAMLESMKNPAPPPTNVKKPEWGVQDEKGATIACYEGDPILTSTPEPTPVPHAPPAANTQSFAGALAPKPAMPAPPAPVEQSNLTSRVIEAPATPLPPVEKVKEDKIFLTGNSGSGKSFIAALLRQLKPHILVVDGIDSARDFNALQAAGLVNYHVVCTGMTLQNRPKRLNIQEPLETTLNQSVKSTLLKGGANHTLHVIWNDPGHKPPSPRLLTVEQFLERLV